MSENAPVVTVPPERPIRLVVRDADLRRSRLTVLLRLLLAIPHLVWLALWGIAVSFVAVALWLAVLLEGKAPAILHAFAAAYLRYATHVGAYVLLAADRYPGFCGAPGYAVDLEIDPPRRQSRWNALARLVLALPALALASALGDGLALGSARGAAAAAAFLTWFAALARGRAPRGLRDLVAYALGYAAQTIGYLLLLTDRYPSSDPALAEQYAELPAHPVRIVVTDELERSRPTVLFRILLAVPHAVWLTLWSAAVLVTALAAWVTALVTGRVPAPLHRFGAAYVRYATHVDAFVTVVGRRFPGFVGRSGSYGIDIEIDPRAQQRRLGVLVRPLLALPALLLAGTLSGVLLVVALLGWWYALVHGRMPEGLRNLGAACLRYGAQTSAYLLLLTDRYPDAGPVLQSSPGREERPAAALPGDAF